MTSHNFGAMLSLQTLAHVGKVGKFVVDFLLYPQVTAEGEFSGVRSTDAEETMPIFGPVETRLRYAQRSYNIYKNR